MCCSSMQATISHHLMVLQRLDWMCAGGPVQVPGSCHQLRSIAPGGLFIKCGSCCAAPLRRRLGQPWAGNVALHCSVLVAFPLGGVERASALPAFALSASLLSLRHGAMLPV
jgi:hypothetical protein